MDFVKLYDDERLDLVDLDRIQTFVDEYLGRMLGGLVGEGAGVLSGCALDTTNIAAVSIGAGLLFTAAPAGTDGKIPTGTVVRHDPAASGQISTVDLSGQVGQTPYLWARAVGFDTDQELRKAWDAATGTEVAMSPSPKTVSRQRVVFGVGVTEPDGSAGWFQFARVTSWNGNVPAIVMLSPFDYNDDGLGGAETRVRAIMGMYPQLGVSQALTTIIAALATIQDKAGTKTWFGAPARDLTELDTAVTDLETGLSNAEAEITNIQDTLYDVTVITSGRMNYTGGSPGYSASDHKGNIKSYSSPSAGVVEIVVEGVLNTVHVTPASDAADFYTPTAATFAACVTVLNYDPLTNYTTFRVHLTKDGVLTDQSFYLTGFGRP